MATWEDNAQPSTLFFTKITKKCMYVPNSHNGSVVLGNLDDHLCCLQLLGMHAYLVAKGVINESSRILFHCGVEGSNVTCTPTLGAQPHIASYTQPTPVEGQKRHRMGSSQPASKRGNLVVLF